MRTALRVMAVCLLALVMGAAFADGVPLFTAGPALQANDPAQRLNDARQPSFVKLHPIALNKAAFGANVLTVSFEGNEYRFVGAMMADPQLPPAFAAKRTPARSWTGREPGGGMMTLTKSATGVVLGTIFLPPSRTFNIATPPGGSSVLIETDANHPVPLQYAKGPASALSAPAGIAPSAPVSAPNGAPAPARPISAPAPKGIQ